MTSGQGDITLIHSEWQSVQEQEKGLSTSCGSAGVISKVSFHIVYYSLLEHFTDPWNRWLQCTEAQQTREKNITAYQKQITQKQNQRTESTISIHLVGEFITLAWAMVCQEERRVAVAGQGSGGWWWQGSRFERLIKKSSCIEVLKRSLQIFLSTHLKKRLNALGSYLVILPAIVPCSLLSLLPPFAIQFPNFAVGLGPQSKWLSFLEMQYYSIPDCFTEQ